MKLAETASRLRHRYVPDHLVGELLTKRWIDTAIPFVFLIVSVATAAALIPEFASAGYLGNSARQLGEFGIVVLALMLVMVGGGIDLSVGSNFALGNITALILFKMLGWPILAVIPAVILVCAAVGALNGALIGFLRLRAFLTTLVTLIIVRAVVDIMVLRYGVHIAAGTQTSPVWDLLGVGAVAGLPFSFVVLVVLAIVSHVFLSRSGLGWRVMAIGGSRRSAYNVGIRVRPTVFFTYVLAGTLVGLASLLFAARLGGAGSDTGVALEISVLTAAVLGGITLGGGRGSVAKALMGAVVVLTITNALVRLGLPSGATPMVLGAVLLLAVGIDVKWNKNRSKILNKIYVSPAFLKLPPSAPCEPGSSPYAVNDRLRSVDLIGLGELEGPEDVIFDSQGHLYTGTRLGDIMRFRGPDYTVMETFAHLGGHPLGLAVDRNDNLIVCDAGMGLYMVHQDGTTKKLTDETNRTPWSVLDDSRLRLADDLDIAPDGRVFFSEATIRYGMHNWAYDALESRGNGRIICYDPRNDSTHTLIRNLIFPNGICMTGDGESFLFAETWACRISRYWFDGPRAGTREVVIEDLPGYPDNINRASDGNFWLALVGMRTPSMDLALTMPSFRRRMARRIAPDELLFPNINTGCVVKFAVQGNVVESLWDLHGENHPMITSMREHRGHLYLGGLLNNRIGRYRIPDADPDWTGFDSYWSTPDRSSHALS